MPSLIESQEFRVSHVTKTTDTETRLPNARKTVECPRCEDGTGVGDLPVTGKLKHTVPGVMALTTPCPHCEDGVRWTSRYGGNDPDVWPIGPCEHCDGTGQVEVVCEYCGDLGATEMLDGRPYHLRCAEEVMADLDPWRTSGPGFGT